MTLRVSVAPLLLLTGAVPVFSQDIPDFVSAGIDDPPFVGTWWAVDEPTGSTTVYRHEPDGALFRLQGSLEAARYVVTGDSVRLEGGLVEIVFPTRSTLAFRVRGDSLWLGADDLAQIRVDRPDNADDPLEGRWMYARLGRDYMNEFLHDGRAIRWMVLGGATWEIMGDTVVIRQSGTTRRALWSVREDLLTMRRESGRDPIRFLRIQDPYALAVLPAVTLDPTASICDALREAAEEFLDEGRMAVYESDIGHWGFYDVETRAMRLWKEVMPQTEVLAHTTAHLAAHALGFGGSVDTEWIAEEAARRCTG